jgi:hypothetical protein
MESIGNTTESLLDSFDPSLAAVPSSVDPTPYAYYGTSQEVAGFDAVNTIVVADHSGTLFMEFSMDNEIWDISFAYQYPASGQYAGTAMYKSTPTLAKYYRSGFINTADFSQNTFRLQTLLHENSRQLSAEFDSITVGAIDMTATNSILTSIDDTLQNITAYDTSINTQLEILANCVTGTVVNTAQVINQVGSKGNVINNATINALASSTALNVSLFGNSVITYQDDNTSTSNSVLVYASVSSGANTYVCIGTLTPVVSADSTFRYSFNVINLSPFNYIYIYNNNTSAPLAGAVCSIYSA